MSTLYPDKNPEDFPALYAAHISAMTTEDLRRKSDIAIQLAWRDAEIERLRALLPKPDADGWIEWNGGPRPVPADKQVEIRLLNGIEMVGRADDFRWFPRPYYGNLYDIKAYRAIEQKDNG